MMLLGDSVFFSLLTLFCYASALAPRLPLTQTSSGRILGHESSITGVTEYLGILYAQQPLGDLRFAAPQPYKSQETFNASAFSPACPQNPAHFGILPNTTAVEKRVVSNFLADNVTVGEDCLTLNIWAKSCKDNSKKSVFVWFYGGQFQTGSTQSLFYQGQKLANSEDIIVVTANYRVNLFGFPGVETNDASLNAGILDIRAALEWVRANIEAFGGDPNAITAGGQSAGAMALDYYAHSPIWQHDPILRGFIFESGQVSTLAPNAANHTSQAWHNVSELVGCASNDSSSQSSSSQEVLSCMRQTPMSKLLSAVSKLHAIGGSAFQVTVDDHIIFPESTYQSIDTNGSFMHIPALIGNNDYEPGFFRLEAATSNITTSNSTIWKLVELSVATCPTHFASQARIKSNVPTWRYRYFGQWPNLNLWTGNGSPVGGSGAWHGSETAMTFGSAEEVSGAPNTERENEVSAYMMKAWGAFIKDPMHGLGAQGLSWPIYKGNGTSTLIELARDFTAEDVGKDVATFADPGPFDAGCDKIGYEGKYSF